MIIDEADRTILDKVVPLEAEYIIGLTATAIDEIDNIEAEYLINFLGFRCYDSGIIADSGVNKPQDCSDLEEFLTQEKGAAKLIFADLTMEL